MTLKEFFTAFGYYGENILEQDRLNKKLYADFVGWGQTSKSLNLLQVTVERIGKSNSIHPDVLIRLLNLCGFQTWEQLEEWIVESDGLLFDPAGYLNIIDPRVPNIEPLMPVTMYDVNRAIQQACGINPTQLLNLDSKYRLISKDKIQPLVDACASDQYTYLAEKRDCDDFVRILLGWLSRYGYGDLAVGFTLVSVIDNVDDFRGMHAISCIVTSDMELMLYDPQGDNLLWQYGDKPPTCDRVIIHQIWI